MAKPTQSEPGLSLDRRQLLASAAALGIGTVPAGVAAEVSSSGQAVTWPKSQDRRRRLGMSAPPLLRKLRKLPPEI
jgi:hypothetical protein